MIEITILIILILFFGCWWAVLIWQDVPGKLQKVLSFVENTNKYLNLSQQNSKLIEQNSFLRRKQEQYDELFNIIIETLREDTSFFRAKLAQRFSSQPEYAEMANLLLQFENRIIHIQTILREEKVISDNIEKIND